MKYIADRGYKDVVLDRYIEKGAVLENEYKKDNIELTEERKDYLVNERKLYIAVEEIPEGQVGDITPVDDIPEGATVVDRVDIVEDNNEEKKEEEEEVIEPSEEKEESNEEIDEVSEEESKEEDKKEVEPVVESDEEKEEKEKTKSNSKTSTKNTKKSEEK